MSLVMTLVEVGYGVGTLATWCAGAFGIGATQSDLKAHAEQARAERLVKSEQFDKKEREFYGGRDAYLRTLYIADNNPHRKAGDEENFRYLVLRSWRKTVGAGLVWPVSVPLYLSYRKGCYVDTTVLKRGELSALQSRVAELKDDVARLEVEAAS